VVGAAYNYIMLLSIILSLVPLMFLGQNRILFYIDKLTCAVFIVDFIIRWITADLRTGVKGVKAFVKYPFTIMAIIDLLSILPSVSALNNAFKVLRTTRLLKIVRVLKFFRYYEPLQMIIRILNREKKVLLTVMTFALFYIFVIALIIFNVEGINPATGKLEFSTFFDALYWSTCTLTTIGYGDYYPVSHIGKAICMFSSLVGIAIIALPSGAITSAYMEEVKNKKDVKS